MINNIYRHRKVADGYFDEGKISISKSKFKDLNFKLFIISLIAFILIIVLICFIFYAAELNAENEHLKAMLTTTA